MRFLIDADCPRSIGHFLQTAGHNTIDIRDIAPGTPDEQIYARAAQESLILISRDTDFTNIMRYPVGKNFGIIVLRLHLSTPLEINSILADLLHKVSEADLLGALTIVRKNRYRIRKF